jgi:hypothetical protein
VAAAAVLLVPHVVHANRLHSLDLVVEPPVGDQEY